MSSPQPVLQNGLRNRLVFRDDPFNILKSKIMELNPNADIDWDDFQIRVHTPVGKQNNRITLELKQDAKQKYVNPNRTVEFLYSIDITLSEIFRDLLGIDEVIHYDDGAYLLRTYQPYGVDRQILPGVAMFRNDAYIGKDGRYTMETSHWDQEKGLQVSNPLDPNAFFITVSNNQPGILTTSNNGPNYVHELVGLIPLMDGEPVDDHPLFVGKQNYQLTILCRKDSEGTLDFNIEGGSFDLRNIILRNSDIYTVHPN